MASIQKPESKIRIHHIMADGTERDSIEGYVLPYEGFEGIYQLLYQMSLEKSEIERKKKLCQLSS